MNRIKTARTNYVRETLENTEVYPSLSLDIGQRSCFALKRIIYTNTLICVIRVLYHSRM